MRITVETTVNANLRTTWDAWTNPEDIKCWNAASEDWHTTESTVDLREGGKFCARMEARDGSVGFDFSGVYTRLVECQVLEYVLDDGRVVLVEFDEAGAGSRVRETFETDTTMDEEQQRQGWQAILDNFARYLEAKSGKGGRE